MRDALRAVTKGDERMTWVGRARLVLILRALEWRHVRSVVYYRMIRAGGKDRVLARVLRIVLPGLSSFEMNVGALGAGFVIGHGYGAVIWAEAIGEDCTIYQNVTVGQSHDKLPTLGNRVHVAPGAVIIGPVLVGDDAVIGANAVVVSDVPPGATMVGIPARPLSTRHNEYTFTSRSRER